MTDTEIVLQMGEELNCAVNIKNHDEERADLDEGINARIDKDGNIEELHFFGYDIKTLPESAAKLTKLRYLTFHKTMVAEVPLWIRELTALERLDFSSTPVPEVPEWLRTMPKKNMPNMKQVVARNIGRKFHGDFEYYINDKDDDDDKAVILGYFGKDEDVIVPCSVDGIPVTRASHYVLEAAFSGRTTIINVTYSEGIQKIRASFWDCERLESINIPASATEVETAINYCPSLTRINVHKDNPNYTDIDGVLFSKDKTKLVFFPYAKSDTGHYAIPEGVTEIHHGALEDCLFTSMSVPVSMTKISSGTFSDCCHLEDITLHNGVTDIEWEAFKGCAALTSIHIPASVTKIDYDSFNGCESLRDITVDENNLEFASHDGALYNKGKTKLLYAPHGLVGHEYHKSMTEIYRYAYRGDKSLLGLHIPAGVTKIGDEAFRDCASLKYITVEEGNPNYADIDGVLFNKDKTQLVCFPRGKTGNYFLPDSVTTIGVAAFMYCTTLKKVITLDRFHENGADCDDSSINLILPKSVTVIEPRAFAFCGWLETLELPDSVTTLQDESFWECQSLKEFTLPDSVTDIADDAFMFCEHIEEEAWERVQKINPNAWIRGGKNVIEIRVG